MATHPVATLVVLGSEKRAGTHISTRTLWEHMRPEERPAVVALAEGPMADALSSLGAEVVRLGVSAPRVLKHPGRLRLLLFIIGCFSNIVWVIGRGIRLGLYLRQHHTPVVHSSLGQLPLVVSIAKLFARFSYVCHWRGVGIGKFRFFTPMLTWSVDRFIAVSEAVKQSLPRPWQEKATVVYNAIDVTQLIEEIPRRTGELRSLAGVSPDTPLIVCLGVYSEIKGQHWLVEAMRHIAEARPDVVCVFMGETKASAQEVYLRKLIARTKALGIEAQCRFFENVDRPAALLADATVSVVPTWGGGEGFGLVIAESMICGAPVVAFRTGAAPEVMKDGETGILVADQNEVELANGVLKLLNDSTLAERMGQAGRVRARSLFDAPTEARRIASIYCEMAGMRPTLVSH